MENNEQHIKPLIALVANTSWSIYNFRLGLIKSLKQCGYRVLVIAPKDNFSAKLIAEGALFHHVEFDNYGTNPFQEVNTLRTLYNVYKKYPISFIFHYTIKPNIYGSIAAWKIGIPSIAITTGLGHLLTFRSKMTRIISLSMYRLAARLSNEVWFLNEADRDEFLSLNIITRNKTHVLPGEGIDTQHFIPTVTKENGASMRMLYAGRIIWDKGYGYFIEAASRIKAKYPYVEFHVVGFIDPKNPNSVPYEDILEHQESGLIKFHGETDDIRPFLQHCHCLVFPSFYREGISRILLEAAAMETPAITTDNVGCRDVVDHDVTGLLVAKKDLDSLTQAMDTFINMPYKDRIEMGKMARLKVNQQHSEEVVIRHYHEKLSFLNTEYFGNMKSRLKDLRVNKNTLD